MLSLCLLNKLVGPEASHCTGPVTLSVASSHTHLLTQMLMHIQERTAYKTQTDPGLYNHTAHAENVQLFPTKDTCTPRDTSTLGYVDRL